LDNVIFEIVNEAAIETAPWQYDMINYIHDYEANTYGTRHPIGMTTVANESPIFEGFQRGSFDSLASSPADWISPGQGDSEDNDWMSNPPDAGGVKVILSDTDHIWGAGGSVDWVWASFTRGLNPILMDTTIPIPGAGSCCAMPADVEDIRLNLGATLAYAQQMDLAHMPPHGELCSTGFCLANPGNEYLVYLPGGGSVNVDLSGGATSFDVEWFNPATNSRQSASPVSGSGWQTLNAPFGGLAVLYLKRRGESNIVTLTMPFDPTLPIPSDPTLTVPSGPTLVSPPLDTPLPGPTVLFEWTDGGAAVVEWWVYMGSSLGANDILDSGSLGSELSLIVEGLPTDGEAIFVRLWYMIEGTWQFSDFYYGSE
jgi:hypothetical protein